MRRLITAAALVLVAGASACALAACASSHSTTPSVHATHSATPVATASPALSASSTQAADNERAFADALAPSVITVPPTLVAGPVMRAYVLFEEAYSAALAATGNPPAASTVSPIPGGYSLCASNGSGCDDFAAFTTDTAGRITGVSVNGQPVAGRIATGSGSAMAGLAMSDVTAYRLTSVQGAVAVVFRVHDISYNPINNNPAVLATFSTPAGQLSEDDSKSAMPSSLSPGETVYGVAVFDTTLVTGTFDLRSNDGYSNLLGSAVIQKASAS